MIRRLIQWLPPMAWAGLIFYMSSRSTMPVAMPFENFDKLVHAGEYGTLCLLIAHAIQPGKINRITMAAWLAAVLASFIYGVSDEMHQAFVPNRSCDPWDALFDLIGAGIPAVAAIVAWRPKTGFPRKRGRR